MPDSVTVRVPADTAHVALLRAAATALAARLDFPVDRIVEIQIAVDEVCSRLMAVTRDPESIEIVFEVGEDAIGMSAGIEGVRREDRPILTEWSRVILEAIAGDIRAGGDGTPATLALRIGRSPK